MLSFQISRDLNYIYIYLHGHRKESAKSIEGRDPWRMENGLRVEYEMFVNTDNGGKRFIASTFEGASDADANQIL